LQNDGNYGIILIRSTDKHPETQTDITENNTTLATLVKFFFNKGVGHEENMTYEKMRMAD